MVNQVLVFLDKLSLSFLWISKILLCIILWERASQDSRILKYVN